MLLRNADGILACGRGQRQLKGFRVTAPFAWVQLVIRFSLSS